MRFGLPGMEIQPGHHICGLYATEAELAQMMIPYFRAGLAGGDACVVVVDGDDAATLLSELGSAAQVSAWRAAGRLEARTVAGAAGRSPGSAGLTVPEIFAAWESLVDQARTRAPSTPVRLGGPASWWLTQTTADNLVSYEIRLTRDIPERVRALCLYDLNRFSGRTVVEAVQAHPLVLVDGRITDNPYYIAPEHWLSEHSGAEVPAPLESEIRDHLHPDP